jgi:uncharacterized protein
MEESVTKIVERENEMRIAILGASGNVGQRLVSEALERGNEVTAVGPTLDKLQALGNVKAKVADITKPDSVAQAIAGNDILVSAVRFVRFDAEQLLQAMRQSDVPRLAVVGGAGSLTSPAGGLVVDGPNFPEVAKAEATAGAKVLASLRHETAIDWTFLSPSAVFTAGERTGNFRLGDDTLLIDANGKSHISFEDFAIAMLDEVEHPAHSRQRFTVGY